MTRTTTRTASIVVIGRHRRHRPATWSSASIAVIGRPRLHAGPVVTPVTGPAACLAIGGKDTKALWADKFLASVVPGVQGEPGLREALAAARVQEAIMRSWVPVSRVTVANEE